MEQLNSHDSGENCLGLFPLEDGEGDTGWPSEAMWKEPVHFRTDQISDQCQTVVILGPSKENASELKNCF